MSNGNTVLSLVNKLKIQQDKAHEAFAESQRLIDQGNRNLTDAHNTLMELAELQGISTVRGDLPYPEFIPNPEGIPGGLRELTGPERIMS